MGRHQQFLKVVACVVIVCLLAQDAAFAVSAKTVSDPQTTPFRAKFFQPFGQVDEDFHGTNGKHITFILDAHDSLEAQKNIVRMIYRAVSGGEIQTVFEEGYEGKLNTDEWFGQIESREAKRKTSYYYLDQLQIGAAEFAHINRKKNFELIGADDKQAYLENIRAFSESKNTREDILEDTRKIIRELQVIQARFFSSEAQDWIRDRKKFSNNALPLPDYVKRWIHKTSSADCPLLKTLASFSGHDDAAVMLLRQARAAEILQEIKLFEQRAEEALLTAPEREIWQFSKAAEKLEKLSALRASESEMRLLREDLRLMDTQKLAQGIAAFKKGPVVLSKKWEGLTDSALRFYDLALTREQAVEKNLAAWKNSGEKEAVLVFGGFHREGITEILRQNGFSYTVLIPKISGLSDRHQGLYKQIMSQGLSMKNIKSFFGSPKNAARPLNRFFDGSFYAEIFEVAALAGANSGMNLETFSLFAQRRFAARSLSGERSRPTVASDARRPFRSEAREAEADKDAQAAGELLKKLSGYLPQIKIWLKEKSTSAASAKAQKAAHETMLKLLQEYVAQYMPTNSFTKSINVIRDGLSKPLSNWGISAGLMAKQRQQDDELQEDLFNELQRLESFIEIAAEHFARGRWSELDQYYDGNQIHREKQIRSEMRTSPFVSIRLSNHYDGKIVEIPSFALADQVWYQSRSDEPVIIRVQNSKNVETFFRGSNPWDIFESSLDEVNETLSPFFSRNQLAGAPGSLLQLIEGRARQASPEHPAVIVDWGYGKGQALLDIAQALKLKGLRKNVRLIGFGNIFSENSKPAFDAGIELVLDPGEYFSRHFSEQSIDILFSHYGLIHYSNRRYMSESLLPALRDKGLLISNGSLETSEADASKFMVRRYSLIPDEDVWDDSESEKKVTVIQRVAGRSEIRLVERFKKRFREAKKRLAVLKEADHRLAHGKEQILEDLEYARAVELISSSRHRELLKTVDENAQLSELFGLLGIHVLWKAFSLVNPLGMGIVETSWALLFLGHGWAVFGVLYNGIARALLTIFTTGLRYPIVIIFTLLPNVGILAVPLQIMMMDYRLGAVLFRVKLFQFRARAEAAVQNIWFLNSSDGAMALVVSPWVPIGLAGTAYALERARNKPEKKSEEGEVFIQNYLAQHREELLMDEVFRKNDALLNVSLAWFEFGLRHRDTVIRFGAAKEGGYFVQSHFDWIQEIVNRFQIKSDKQILDIGSGNGLAAMAFHILTGAKVTSIEIDSDRWAVLREFLDFLKEEKGVEYEGIEFKKADFLETDISAFDYLYFYFTAPSKYEDDFGLRVIDHLKQKLKPGAKFISPAFFLSEELQEDWQYQLYGQKDRFAKLGLNDAGIAYQGMDLGTKGLGTGFTTIFSRSEARKVEKTFYYGSKPEQRVVAEIESAIDASNNEEAFRFRLYDVARHSGREFIFSRKIKIRAFASPAAMDYLFDWIPILAASGIDPEIKLSWNILASSATHDGFQVESNRYFVLHPALAQKVDEIQTGMGGAVIELPDMIPGNDPTPYIVYRASVKNENQIVRIDVSFDGQVQVRSENRSVAERKNFFFGAGNRQIEGYEDEIRALFPAQVLEKFSPDNETPFPVVGESASPGKYQLVVNLPARATSIYLGNRLNPRAAQAAFKALDDKTLLLKHGWLPHYQEAITAPEFQYLERYGWMVFAHWLKNYFIPFAREMGFEKIWMVRNPKSRRALSEDAMRSIGFEKQGRRALWILNFDKLPPVMIRRSEMRRIRLSEKKAEEIKTIAQSVTVERKPGGKEIAQRYLEDSKKYFVTPGTNDWLLSYLHRGSLPQMADLAEEHVVYATTIANTVLRAHAIPYIPIYGEENTYAKNYFYIFEAEKEGAKEILGHALVANFTPMGGADKKIWNIGLQIFDKWRGEALGDKWNISASSLRDFLAASIVKDHEPRAITVDALYSVTQSEEIWKSGVKTAAFWLKGGFYPLSLLDWLEQTQKKLQTADPLTAQDLEPWNDLIQNGRDSRNAYWVLPFVTEAAEIKSIYGDLPRDLGYRSEMRNPTRDRRWIMGVGAGAAAAYFAGRLIPHFNEWTLPENPSALIKIAEQSNEDRALSALRKYYSKIRRDQFSGRYNRFYWSNVSGVIHHPSRRVRDYLVQLLAADGAYVSPKDLKMIHSSVVSPEVLADLFSRQKQGFSDRDYLFLFKDRSEREIGLFSDAAIKRGGSLWDFARAELGFSGKYAGSVKHVSLELLLNEMRRPQHGGFENLFISQLQIKIEAVLKKPLPSFWPEKRFLISEQVFHNQKIRNEADLLGYMETILASEEAYSERNSRSEARDTRLHVLWEHLISSEAQMAAALSFLRKVRDSRVSRGLLTPDKLNEILKHADAIGSGPNANLNNTVALLRILGVHGTLKLIPGLGMVGAAGLAMILTFSTPGILIGLSLFMLQGLLRATATAWFSAKTQLPLRLALIALSAAPFVGLFSVPAYMLLLRDQRELGLVILEYGWQLINSWEKIKERVLWPILMKIGGGALWVLKWTINLTVVGILSVVSLGFLIFSKYIEWRDAGNLLLKRTVEWLSAAATLTALGFSVFYFGLFSIVTLLVFGAAAVTFTVIYFFFELRNKFPWPKKETHSLKAAEQTKVSDSNSSRPEARVSLYQAVREVIQDRYYAGRQQEELLYVWDKFSAGWPDVVRAEHVRKVLNDLDYIKRFHRNEDKTVYLFFALMLGGFSLVSLKAPPSAKELFFHPATLIFTGFLAIGFLLPIFIRARSLPSIYKSIGMLEELLEENQIEIENRMHSSRAETRESGDQSPEGLAVEEQAALGVLLEKKRKVTDDWKEIVRLITKTLPSGASVSPADIANAPAAKGKLRYQTLVMAVHLTGGDYAGFGLVPQEKNTVQEKEKKIKAAVAAIRRKKKESTPEAVLQHLKKPDHFFKGLSEADLKRLGVVIPEKEKTADEKYLPILKALVAAGKAFETVREIAAAAEGVPESYIKELGAPKLTAMGLLTGGVDPYQKLSRRFQAAREEKIAAAGEAVRSARNIAELSAATGIPATTLARYTEEELAKLGYFPRAVKMEKAVKELMQANPETVITYEVLAEKITELGFENIKPSQLREWHTHHGGPYAAKPGWRTRFYGLLKALEAAGADTGDIQKFYDRYRDSASQLAWRWEIEFWVDLAAKVLAPSYLKSKWSDQARAELIAAIMSGNPKPQLPSAAELNGLSVKDIILKWLSVSGETKTLKPSSRAVAANISLEGFGSDGAVTFEKYTYEVVPENPLTLMDILGHLGFSKASEAPRKIGEVAQIYLNGIAVTGDWKTAAIPASLHTITIRHKNYSKPQVFTDRAAGAQKKIVSQPAGARSEKVTDDLHDSRYWVIGMLVRAANLETQPFLYAAAMAVQRLAAENPGVESLRSFLNVFQRKSEALGLLDLAETSPLFQSYQAVLVQGEQIQLKARSEAREDPKKQSAALSRQANQIIKDEGDLNEAVGLAEEAIQLDYSNAYAWVALIQAQRGLERYEEALEAFTFAERDVPGNQYVRAMFRGILNSFMDQRAAENRLSDAVNKLREIYPDIPEEFQASVKLAVARAREAEAYQAIESGDFAQALQIAEQINQLDPANQATDLLLASVFIHQGQLGRAEDQLNFANQKFLAQNPRNYLIRAVIAGRKLLADQTRAILKEARGRFAGEKNIAETVREYSEQISSSADLNETLNAINRNAILAAREKRIIAGPARAEMREAIPAKDGVYIVAEKIRELLAGEPEKAVVVAVEGASGDGKSTFSHIFESKSVVVLHRDDYFSPVLDGSVDWEGFERDLREQVSRPGTKVVFVEGFQILRSLLDQANFFDLRVQLVADENTRIQNILTRNPRWTYSQALQWIEKYDEPIFTDADFVLENSARNRPDSKIKVNLLSKDSFLSETSSVVPPTFLDPGTLDEQAAQLKKAWAGWVDEETVLKIKNHDGNSLSVEFYSKDTDGSLRPLMTVARGDDKPRHFSVHVTRDLKNPYRIARERVNGAVPPGVSSAEFFRGFQYWLQQRGFKEAYLKRTKQRKKRNSFLIAMVEKYKREGRILGEGTGLDNAGEKDNQERPLFVKFNFEKLDLRPDSERSEARQSVFSLWTPEMETNPIEIENILGKGPQFPRVSLTISHYGSEQNEFVIVVADAETGEKLGSFQIFRFPDKPLYLLASFYPIGGGVYQPLKPEYRNSGIAETLFSWLAQEMLKDDNAELIIRMTNNLSLLHIANKYFKAEMGFTGGALQWLAEKGAAPSEAPNYFLYSKIVNEGLLYDQKITGEVVLESEWPAYQKLKLNFIEAEEGFARYAVEDSEKPVNMGSEVWVDPRGFVFADKEKKQSLGRITYISNHLHVRLHSSADRSEARGAEEMAKYIFENFFIDPVSREKFLSTHLFIRTLGGDRGTDPEDIGPWLLEWDFARALVLNQMVKNLGGVERLRPERLESSLDLESVYFQVMELASDPQYQQILSFFSENGGLPIDLGIKIDEALKAVRKEINGVTTGELSVEFIWRLRREAEDYKRYLEYITGAVRQEDFWGFDLELERQEWIHRSESREPFKILNWDESRFGQDIAMVTQVSDFILNYIWHDGGGFSNFSVRYSLYQPEVDPDLWTVIATYDHKSYGRERHLAEVLSFNRQGQLVYSGHHEDRYDQEREKRILAPYPGRSFEPIVYVQNEGWMRRTLLLLLKTETFSEIHSSVYGDGDFSGEQAPDGVQRLFEWFRARPDILAERADLDLGMYFYSISLKRSEQRAATQNQSGGTVLISQKELAGLSEENYAALFKFAYTRPEIKWVIYGDDPQAEARLHELKAIPNAKVRLNTALSEADAIQKVKPNEQGVLLEASTAGLRKLPGNIQRAKTDGLPQEMALGFYLLLNGLIQGLKQDTNGFLSDTSGWIMGEIQQFLNNQVFARAA